MKDTETGWRMPEPEEWIAIASALTAAHYATGGEEMDPQEILDLPESIAMAELGVCEPYLIGQFFYMSKKFGIDHAINLFQEEPGGSCPSC